MAEFKIYLTAETQGALAGIGKVEKSIKSYRNAVIESQGDATKLAEAEQNYYNAVNKQIGLTSTLKEGKAGLAQTLKLLKTEQYELNTALGSGNEYTDQYQKAINDVNAQLEKYKTSSKEASEKTNVLGLKFASVVVNILKFQVVMKVMNTVKTVLRESTQVAAEAEQVFSKLATVFAGVEDSASKMASTLATSLGVAQSTAASALSTVGDLLQAQGMGTNDSLIKANEWVEKFQDIIAFKDINMDLEEFAQNFMSGATGNLRNFRTFGSIVKESAVQAELAKRGLDSLTGSQLELEKMTIRAEMALEQQANAIGATAREWETTLSISRRYDEQNKALMENIGDAINTKLNPLKSWWADIAEQINKAHDAQAQFAAGQKNISVYDINNNDNDYKSFKNKIRSEFITSNKYNPYRNRPEAISSTANRLIELMTEYNATMGDVESVWTDMPDSIRTALEPLVVALEQQKKEEQKIKEIQADWVAISEKAIDFMQQLDSITGADSGISGNAVYNYANEDYPTTQQAYDSLARDLNIELNDAIKEIISSFKTSDWKTYASSLDLAFGSATETDSLDTKITELKTLYGYMNAFALQDGVISKTEQGYLNELLGIYQSILDRQQDIADEEERQLEFAEQRKNLLSSVSSYRSQIAQIGMTDEQKALYEFEQQLNEALSVVGLTAEETAELTSVYNEGVSAIKKLYKAQDTYNAELQRTEKLKDYQEGTSDYVKQLRQLRMSDSEKTIDDLVSQLTGDTELDNAIQDQINAFVKLTEATTALTNAQSWETLKQNAIGSIGTIGGYVSKIAYGEGDLWARILEVCLDILEQSEYWSNIVAKFDELLEPIFPIVESILSVLEGLEIVFDTVAFVIKVVASIVAEVLYTVNMVIDIVEWLWDNIKIALKNVAIDVYNLFHWSKKDRENYKSLFSYWDETTKKTDEILNKIWNKIPSEDRDLSTLESLLKSGIINLDQYNAGLRVQQKDMIFDPVAPVSYIASSGQGDTTIKYGDISIVINGGNKEEIQSVLINVMRKAGYDVSNVPISA